MDLSLYGIFWLFQRNHEKNPNEARLWPGFVFRSMKTIKTLIVSLFQSPEIILYQHSCSLNFYCTFVSSKPDTHYEKESTLFPDACCIGH
jgi:hypothetical protein